MFPRNVLLYSTLRTVATPWERGLLFLYKWILEIDINGTLPLYSTFTVGRYNAMHGVFML